MGFHHRACAAETRWAGKGRTWKPHYSGPRTSTRTILTSTLDAPSETAASLGSRGQPLPAQLPGYREGVSAEAPLGDSRKLLREEKGSAAGTVGRRDPGYPNGRTSP